MFKLTLLCKMLTTKNKVKTSVSQAHLPFTSDVCPFSASGVPKQLFLGYLPHTGGFL